MKNQATSLPGRFSIDPASWELGRLDALHRRRRPSQPVACPLSWSSGWIEGNAERQQLSANANKASHR